MILRNGSAFVVNLSFPKPTPSYKRLLSDYLWGALASSKWPASAERVCVAGAGRNAVGDERQLYRCMRSANFLALSASANRAAKYLGSCSNVRVDSPTACGSHFERMSPIFCDISR
jgi:hypothetical protein